MKKNIKLLVCSIFVLAVPAYSNTSTDLVETPTADIVDYYSTEVNFNMYSNGGILSSINFGVFKRLNMGFSWDIDRIIGTEKPEIRMPTLKVKFRIFDGTDKWPAIAIGYDGQGYRYDSSSGSYLNKEKGIYIVFSVETIAKGLEYHLGANIQFTKVDNKDVSSSYGFTGFNYTLTENEKKLVSFIVEYDNLFKSAKDTRLNSAIRIFPTNSLNLDLAIKDISSPRNLTAERILRVNYQGKF